MRNLAIFIIVIMSFCLPYHETARILVLAPFYGPSHQKIMETLTQALLDRGHNITIITVNIKDNPPKNYHQIKVERNLELENIDSSSLPEISHFEQLRSMWKVSISAMRFMLNSKELQDFIKNDNSQFDLIINEDFYQEFTHVFAQKYKSPVVTVDTTTMFSHIGDFMGNPIPSIYAPHESFKLNIETLYGKINNVLLTTIDRIARKYYYLPMVDKVIQEYFSCWNISLPTAREMENQVSLVLVNSHYSFDTIIPLVPSIVQIGGIHIQQPTPLNEEIQKFLDEAKEGAIFFSLGGEWKTRNLGEKRLKTFVSAFKKLKQRIIWKVDGAMMKLDNLMTGSFFPQNDILAHPNVKAFISHGGMLSTLETIYHGVPVIGIPIFWDQYSNIQKMKKHGVVISLDYLNLETKDIISAVNEITNNPKYTDNMKILSSKFKDRPNNSKDLAMYWIEYVIKYNGSQFLKPPLVNMNFLEYYLIEIVIVILTFLFILFIYFVSKLLFRSNKINVEELNLKNQNVKNKKKKY